MTGQFSAGFFGRSQIFGKTILNVAFPFNAVSENAVGGAEQVVARLDKAIVENGGTSLVVATADSDVCGTLLPIPAMRGPITPEKENAIWRECRSRIAEAVREHNVDLVHLHGIDFHRYWLDIFIPQLVTLHLPVSWYPREIFKAARGKNTLLHCVSPTQHRDCPDSNALLAPICNGVEVSCEPPAITKGNYVVALGRICPEKGFHIALEAARRANIKMFLAGSVFDYETHYHYFETQIVPRLDEQRQFIGPVGREKRNALLREARCVLVPSLAAETSSLVAMEALASGTPVVAFPRGALPDIIQDGVNGFLVNDEAEMAEAIQYAVTLSPQQCWETARCRLDAQRMVSAYLRRYEIIMRGCSSFASPPHAFAAA
jgi:glycosyltransferase involved in cell wall biosynthesis